MQTTDAEGNRKLILSLPEGDWVFGQKLQIQIVRPTQSKVLPAEAIVSWQRGNYAFILVQDQGERKLRPVPVQIQARDGKWVEILPLTEIAATGLWLQNKVRSAMALFENQEEGGHH